MLNKAKILAIDDETKALDLLKLSLEAHGFDVLTASDGQAGLDMAIEQEPDLIILDIRMPKLDGWEVCKGLKLNSITKRIPIIILSAFSSARDLERGKNLGVEAYLTKPMDPNTLIMLLENILGIVAEKS
jgi:DNA-binding response OmpR family regulator